MLLIIIAIKQNLIKMTSIYSVLLKKYIFMAIYFA